MAAIPAKRKSMWQRTAMSQRLFGQPEIRSGGERAAGMRLGAMDGRCAPILPRSGGSPALEPLLPHTPGHCEFRVEREYESDAKIGLREYLSMLRI